MGEIHGGRGRSMMSREVHGGSRGRGVTGISTADGGGPWCLAKSTAAPNTEAHGYGDWGGPQRSGKEVHDSSYGAREVHGASGGPRRIVRRRGRSTAPLEFHGGRSEGGGPRTIVR